MDFKKLTSTDFNKLSDTSDYTATNRNHIIFGLYGFDVSPDEITERLNLKPTKVGWKGEEYEIGGRIKTKKIRDYNFWELETKTVTNDFIGDLVSNFAQEIIIDRKTEIKTITKACQCKLTIVQYYQDGLNPGYFFNSELIKLLA